MRGERSASILSGLHQLWNGASHVARSERQLLDRFVRDGDTNAFTALVERHGRMVLGVCQAVVGDPTAAEDAFQATFLVLVRRAGSIRDGDQLGPWLHGVARRVALRARRVAARQRGREITHPDLVASAPGRPQPTAEACELTALIHAEIDRLSLAERSAVTLCDLEGLSHQEAADQLGWPLGTVKSRVARGRDRLRARLVRRGVTLAATGWAVSPTKPLVAAVLPATLVASTTRAAIALAAGRLVASGLVSVSVLTLSQGVARTMILTQLRAAAITLVAASSVVAVPTLIAYQQEPGRPDPGQSASKPAEPKVEPPPATTPPTEITPTSIRLQVAEAAVRSIAERDDKHDNPVDDDTRFAWYHRLAETQLWVARTKTDRLAILEAHVKRHARFAEWQTKAITTRFSSNQPVDVQQKGLEESWAAADAAGQALRSALVWLALARRASDGVVNPAPPPYNSKPVEPADPTPIELPTHWVMFKPVVDDERKNQLIVAKLGERISMKFPNDTPLSDVQKYIEQSTQDEAAGLATGIPIYVDPKGLKAAGVTIASTVAINLEGVPLRNTLTLILDQLDLTYVVEGGVLVIRAINQPESPTARPTRSPLPGEQRGNPASPSKPNAPSREKPGTASSQPESPPNK